MADSTTPDAPLVCKPHAGAALRYLEPLCCVELRQLEIVSEDPKREVDEDLIRLKSLVEVDGAHAETHA
jgi:hypothetical protein